jgi:hypothetical protein
MNRQFRLKLILVRGELGGVKRVAFGATNAALADSAKMGNPAAATVAVDRNSRREIGRVGKGAPHSPFSFSKRGEGKSHGHITQMESFEQFSIKWNMRHSHTA